MPRFSPPFTKPDFICIGAQKAGSTWIFRNLNKHPRILTPPLKELHYFDRDRSYPSPSFLATDSPMKRIIGLRKDQIKYKEKLIRTYRKALKNRDLQWVRWNNRYFFGRCSDAWYASLFEEISEGFITGEATPAYSMLSPKDIERISRNFPNLRIIYIMRNPIERAWSQLRMSIAQGKLEKNPTPERMAEYLDSPFQSLRGDYLRTLKNWETYLPRDQIFIDFFDNIVAAPEQLLNRMFSFLGLDYPDNVQASIERSALMSSPQREMPTEVHEFLKQRYHPQIEVLANRFGDPPAAWLASSNLGK